MSDEPTPWELQRTLDAIRGDLRDMRGDINQRLDKVVTSDLFGAYQAAMDRRMGEAEADIAAMREQREADVQRRATDRRLIIGGFIFPVVVGALMLWLQIRTGV